MQFEVVGQSALAGQGDPGGGENLAGDSGFGVRTQRRRRVRTQQLFGDRRAMSLPQFVFRGGREGGSGVGEALDPIVGQTGAVHDVGVWPPQAGGADGCPALLRGTCHSLRLPSQS